MNPVPRRDTGVRGSTHTADVVVIGAGIVGASCAYQLAERGLSVAVLEREAAPALGSTGRSAAGVRVQFTTAPNIALSMYSLPIYRTFRERHGFEVGYRDIGYLLLVPPERWDDHLASVALQRSMGAPVEVLAPEEAVRYVPMATEGLAGVTYGPWDGVIDPHMATHAWVSMGRRAGVRYHLREAVTGVRPEGDGWLVETGTRTFSCEHLVNAAGTWSGRVGRLAGLEVPVRPKRIQIFLSAPIADERTYPLTIDLGTGVYLRSEGDRILFGMDTHADDGFTEGVDWRWLEEVLLAGVDRYPWWVDLGVDRQGSWWGYYGVTPDNNPVIGFNPGASRWVDACGFSGHGIMHAPATGLAVSELIADGHAHTLDVTAFRHGRFEEAGVAVEANIF
ncbi:MAG: FAD-binding oxidoreductase [Gemmatimonadetes bacterium]|nr:FAD-binding oxidoreductase [Gemmatimonadota bacterium]MYG22459.1 FAD-binding oxidoreductase [Gemmatimonadota bacterium]MYJ39567.1 FAD-binding oxidoreductase [Gemmatimonadota bacterium]